MTTRLRVEDAARDELRDAAEWYEDRRSGLGVEFLEEAARTLQLIERHPRIGAPHSRGRERGRIRHVPLCRFPYAVVYRECRDEIQVVAFAHSSRRPGYWRGR